MKLSGCYARRYDEAIESERKTLEMDPHFMPALITLGNAYLQKGLFKEAIATLQRTTTLSGGIAWGDAPTLGHAYAVSGERRMALEVLEEYRALMSAKQIYVSPYKIAAVYKGLGEKDQAFEWLDTAYQDNCLLLVYLMVDPVWDPLRSDPRFQDLLRRMSFPE